MNTSIVLLLLLLIGDAIIASQPLQLVSVTPGNTSCSQPNQGSLTITIAGGVPPYIYNIGTQPEENQCVLFASSFSSSTQTTFYNLKTDGSLYCFNITDNAGNSLTPPQLYGPLGSPAPVIFTAQANNPLCNGQNGTITVIATGGSSVYQVSLNGGTFSAPQASPIQISVAAGSYNVLVRDTSGCPVPAPQQVTLINPASVTFATSSTNPLCAGANGSILIVAQGGTGLYSFSLNGGPFFPAFQPSPISFPAPAGTYAVAVVDSNNCSGGQPQTVQLIEPAPIVFPITSRNATIGQSNGSITVPSASGGSGTGYAATIDGTNFVPVPATFANLAAGTYDVAVRDSNGCISDPPVQIIVFAVDPLEVSAIAVAQNCSRGTFGSITARATGGTRPYQYSLNNGSFQTSNQFVNLAAGTYTVTVLDHDGRTANTTVTVRGVRTAVGDPITDFISLVLCKGNCS